MKTKTMKVKSVILVVVLAILGVCLSLEAQQGGKTQAEQLKIVGWEELKYPILARQARVEGLVVLQVKLDEQGRVTDATSFWGNKLLVPDSVANVKNWRFEPHAQTTIVVVYNFRISDGVCRPNMPSSHFAFWPPNFAAVTTCEELVQP